MADNVDLILQLLQEQRDEQKRASDMLGDVRVAVASVQRTVEGQQAGIAAMRADQAQIFDRLRAVETRAERIAHIDETVTAMDARVRVLEQHDAGNKVVHGGLLGFTRETLKAVLQVMVGVIVAWLMLHH